MSTIMNLVDALSRYSPRLGEKEVQTAHLIEDIVSRTSHKLLVQQFATTVPLVEHAYLKINNQTIECIGSSFESGKITSLKQINFSPYSDYIETINYTKLPSVYISRKDKNLLKKNAEVDGFVSVTKYSYVARNFLVGNTIKPKNIIFAHYDCIGGGAIDNAGGVAVCIKLLKENQSLTDENLIVFVSNEEISYDTGVYWGKGYREFEKIYPNLLRTADQIIVVDGVGLTKPKQIKKDIDNFFPIRYLNTFKNKIKIVSSLQSKVLTCYHCEQDTPDKLKDVYLSQSQNLLFKMLE